VGKNEALSRMGILQDGPRCMLRGKREGVANVVSLLHAISGFGLLMWVGMFLLSRVHKLHDAYGMLELERSNDEWLVAQCKKDDFYHNMKHHSSLCDSVQRKQHDILLLRALERVIEETYLCGYDSCGKLLVAVGDYMLGRGIVLTACLALAALLLPTLLLPIFRRKLNGMADQRMQELYNRPFGDTHYLQTHPYQAVEYLN
jgi:hypothetical protein